MDLSRFLSCTSTSLSSSWLLVEAGGLWLVDSVIGSFGFFSLLSPSPADGLLSLSSLSATSWALPSCGPSVASGLWLIRVSTSPCYGGLSRTLDNRNTYSSLACCISVCSTWPTRGRPPNAQQRPRSLAATLNISADYLSPRLCFSFHSYSLFDILNFVLKQGRLNLAKVHHRGSSYIPPFLPTSSGTNHTRSLVSRLVHHSILHVLHSVPALSFLLCMILWLCYLKKCGKLV